MFHLTNHDFHDFDASDTVDFASIIFINFGPLTFFFYDLVIIAYVSDLDISFGVVALLDEKATAELACVYPQDLAVEYLFKGVVTDNADFWLIRAHDSLRARSHLYLKLSFDTFNLRYLDIFFVELEMMSRSPFVLVIELFKMSLNGTFVRTYVQVLWTLRLVCSVGFDCHGGEGDKNCSD